MKLLTAATLLTYATSSLFHGASAATCFEGDAPFHKDDWKYCQEISDTLHMYYTPLDDTVMLGLHATEGVTGWSSLAPAGNGGMKGKPAYQSILLFASSRYYVPMSNANHH